MPSNYLETSERDAKEMAKTLKQIRGLLESDKLRSVYEGDATELLDKVKKVLENFNSARESLASLEEDTIIKTDPSFNNQRNQFIRRIEKAKIDFEYDIVPALEKVTRQVVENSKQNPSAQVDTSKLPPPSPAENWTTQKVLDKASQLVDQAAKAGAILTKAYTLAKALGFVLGIPIP